MIHSSVPCAVTALLLVTLGSPSPACAAERALTLGFAPSYAYVVLQDQSEPEGGGGALYLTYGVTDSIALRVSAAWTGHAIDEAIDSEGGKQEGGLFQVLSFSAGLSYELDLVDWTPSLEAGVELLNRHFAGASTVDLGVQFGLCIDYWFRPWLAIGFGFHYHAFLTDLATYPVYFDTGPRLSIRWR